MRCGAMRTTWNVYSEILGRKGSSESGGVCMSKRMVRSYLRSESVRRSDVLRSRSMSSGGRHRLALCVQPELLGKILRTDMRGFLLWRRFLSIQLLKWAFDDTALLSERCSFFGVGIAVP